MTNPVDKQFFVAVKKGDKESIDKAFEQVYVTYVKLVAFVVGKYVSDKETIKDIVNDTFLNLFNHAKDIKGSVKYYLTVSAKNAAVNYVAKRGRSGTEVPLEYANGASDTYHGRSEVVEDLKKVLSAEEVDIILLHVTEGYTFKEIAAMKGKNTNTIITIYNRAIKKYKKGAKEYA